MSLASAISISGSAFMKESPCNGAGAADPKAAVMDSAPKSAIASLLSPLLSPSRSATQLLAGEPSLAPPTPTLVVDDDESRAYKLALELSMVGLDDRSGRLAANGAGEPPSRQHIPQPRPPQQPEYSFDSLRAISAAVAAVAQTHPNGLAAKEASMRRNGFAELTQGGVDLQLVGADDRTKKSQNMTECVPVPSSEHVAEIVGRQGCKIKALRTKTNTYIKTPVRGEEPVFVVTGRKEDVAKAKREIISAAEHFSFIRASRRPFADASSAGSAEVSSFVAAGSVNSSRKGPINGGPPLPGQITIKVRVPYRVVGLVVGPKGATIKHIQQETQTYIITPSRDKEPVFEVTGLPDNVQAARKQIESHIALRTGSLQDEPNLPPSAVSTPASVPGAPGVYTISQIFNEEINPDFLASLYKNGMFDYVEPDSAAVSHNGMCASPLMRAESEFQPAGPLKAAGAAYLPAMGSMSGSHFAGKVMAGNPMAAARGESVASHQAESVHQMHTGGDGTAMHRSLDTSPGLHGGMLRSCSSASSTASSKSTNCSNGSRPELLNIWKGVGAADAADLDEGIGESPNIWTAAMVARTGPNSSPSTSISPTDSLLGEISSAAYNFTRAVPHAPLDAGLSLKALELTRRECLICNNKSVTAALVPCGHNMFCMECANTICCSADATCPVCNSPVYQAMRIFS